jgi:hypothetical protein
MKFSIITVIKNDLFKIKLTLKSLKNQTFKDYQHIIFDGNSTDGTSEYLNKNLNGNRTQFKTVQNLTINNYGIKPLTQESVIGAFDSYNSKHKNAFNGCIYDMITGDYVSFKIEHVFYGIIKELKDYYGITDISREKIIFNNNGEITLTTIQEFIKTNIVMNNINIILEWINNLQNQIPCAGNF